MDRKFNFNQLRYFVHVAQAGSLSSAARKLGIAQPTLSIQLRHLERTLNGRLMHRSRHGVTLTPRGQSLYESCRRPFELLENELGVRMPSSANPILRVGISLSIVPQEILRLNRRLRKHPGPLLSVTSHSWESLRQKLERRQLDVAVCDADLTPQPAVQFRAKRLSRTPVYFVASASLKLKSSLAKNLAAFPLLLRAPGNPIRLQIESFFKKFSIQPHIGAEVENPDLIHELARDGAGIAALDVYSIRSDVVSRRLVRLHSKPIGLHSDTWLFAPNAGTDDPRIVAAKEALFGA